MGSPVGETLGVLVAFSAGLFSFLSPCVLPLFPSYLSFVTGMSVDRLAREVSGFERSLVMLHSLAFIAGFTVVFVSLGATFTLASNEKTVDRGVGLLLACSAGLGVPFLVFSAGLGVFLRFFKRYRPVINVVERAAGVLLVVVGVLVATNYYIVLNSWAVSFTPAWLLKRL